MSFHETLYFNLLGERGATVWGGLRIDAAYAYGWGQRHSSCWKGQRATAWRRREKEARRWIWRSIWIWSGDQSHWDHPALPTGRKLPGDHIITFPSTSGSGPSIDVMLLCQPSYIWLLLMCWISPSLSLKGACTILTDKDTQIWGGTLTVGM